MAERPNTPFLVGETFEQLEAKDVWVTPTGGSIKTLADALADTGGGTVTKVVALDGPFLAGVTITTSGTIQSSINPTAHGVLIGQGALAVAATAAMTNGQLLVGQTGANPLPRTISGDITINNVGAAALTVTGVSAGTYGDGTHVAQIEVDAAGRILTATDVAITGAAPSGSAGGDLSGTYPDPTVAQVNGAVVPASATVLASNSSRQLIAGAAVTSVIAGTGLSGGTITAAGTVALATRTASTLMGNPGTAAATPSDITVGSGLSLSTAGTLTATGSGGSVTSVVAGTGLSGGTITGAGTIALASIAATSLLGNSGLSPAIPSAVPFGVGFTVNNGTLTGDWQSGIVTTLGSHLSLTSGTLDASAPGTGTVTSVVAGAGLAGGTITSTGTISFATIAAGDFLANTTGGAAVPIATALGTITAGAGLSGGPFTAAAGGTFANAGVLAIGATAGSIALGSNLSMSGQTLTVATGAGGVTSVVGGTGLSGGTITSAGTLAVTAATTAALGGIIVGSNLTISGGTLSASAPGTGTVTSIVAGTGLSGGTITSSGTVAVTAATTAALGGVIAGTGITVSSGTISSTPAFSAVTGTATYAQLPSELSTIPIPFVFAGLPASGAIVNVPMTFSVIVPASLTGTVVYDTTLTTSNAAFLLNKIASGNVVTAIGTVTVTSSNHFSATLAGAGGTLAINDVLQIVAPTADATLADLTISVSVNRV